MTQHLLTSKRSYRRCVTFSQCTAQLVDETAHARNVRPTLIIYEAIGAYAERVRQATLTARCGRLLEGPLVHYDLVFGPRTVETVGARCRSLGCKVSAFVESCCLLLLAESRLDERSHELG